MNWVNCVTTLLLPFFLLSSLGLEAQSDILKFRQFEKRVRYTHPDSLLIYAGKSDTNNKKNKVFKYLAEGKYYYQKSEFDKSYTLLSKARSLAIEQKSPLLSAEISLDISSCLSILENTGQSLDQLLYAKSMFDEVGSDNQNARLHIALGELYRKIGQYDKADKMLFLSKKFIKNDPGLKASYYNRKAAIKSETSQMDSAYYFSKLALKFSEKSNDISLAAISENEIGYILKHKNKKDSAIIHFKKADSIFTKCGMTAYSLQSKLHFAILIAEKGEHAYALPIYKEGFKIANDNNWYRLKRDYAESIRNSYIILNIKDSAYYYDKVRLEANLSLISNQNEMNTRLVESMFRQEKYQKQIDKNEQLLKNERILREKAESEKSFMTLVIILIILVLLLSLYMIFVQVNRRRKIFQDKLEKERQNKELEALLKNNEALVQEISHRVKNNLSVLSGLIGIQKVRAANPEVKQELGEIILRIDSISAIHNQLYDSKEAALINLRKVFHELSGNICLAMGYSPEKILLLEMEDVSLDIARSVNLSMILNELLTNSFKHAVKSEENKIKISLKNLNKEIILNVADQGKGINLSEAELKSKTSGSMGLYLIDILCRQLKAKKETMLDDNYFHISVSFKL